MMKLLCAAVGAALMMTGAASATPLVAAASESTAIAGAAAGATAGGGGGGGGGSASTKEGDTIGGAIGFPAPVQPVDCFYGVGLVWNFASWTAYSDRCGADHTFREAMMAAQSSDPLARLMSVTAMCSHPDPNVRAMGDVALDDAFSAKYGLPAMGGCPNAK